MAFIIFFGYEFLTSLLPFGISFVVFQNMKRKKGILCSKPCNLAVWIFAVYIIAVYQITGAGTLYDGFWYHWEVRQGQLNLSPFSNGVDVTSYLNVLLFIPLGIIVPYIWKAWERLIPVVGVALLLTTLIELSQLLNNRRTDVDDIILNVAGAVIGFGLYKIWRILSGKQNQISSMTAGELPVYLLVMFVGRFLLFDGMGLARLLYGF